MSWRFPARQPVELDPMDVDDANDAMLPAAQELSGELGEHNFASGAINSRSLVADDVYMRLYQYVQAVDGSTTGASTTDVADVEMTGSFAPIVDGSDDRFEKTITASREGMLWIMASFQTQQAWPGVIYALFIDGALLEETATGTVEASTEQIVSNAAHGISSPGMIEAHAPVVLEAVTPIQAGSHTVEVRAMVVEGRRGTALAFRVYSRELNLIELSA